MNKNIALSVLSSALLFSTQANAGKPTIIGWGEAITVSVECDNFSGSISLPLSDLEGFKNGVLFFDGSCTFTEITLETPEPSIPKSL